MQPGRDQWLASPLLIALAVSLAVHLSLVFTIRVHSPAAQPHAAAIPARLVPRSPDGTGPAHPERADSPDRSSTRTSPRREAEARIRAGASGSNRAEPSAATARPTVAPVDTAATLVSAAAPVVQPAPDASALPQVEMPVLTDPTWYPARQLDVLPRALSVVKPAWPAGADADASGGDVTLLLLVDETGQVHEVSVAEANPEGRFEDVALAAFRAARFLPAEKDGRAVRSRILVKVAFRPDARPAAPLPAGQDTAREP